MKTIMLVLVLCAVLPITSAKIFYKIQESRPDPKTPLGMEDNSVDDMYFGCNEKMSSKVQSEYFPRESKDKSFSSAWRKAAKCLKRAIAKKQKEDQALTNDHLQAICLYTSGGKSVFYKEFNHVIQTRASRYNTVSFSYHAVHFWLTTALQILSSNNQTCHITYRRSSISYVGKVNQIIRFGYFASTSYKPDMVHFGKETCFYIKTCSGAFLKEYPTLGSKEQEVLIPPNEMFNITKIAKQFYKNLRDCNQVYVLKSVGVHSNLNCRAAYPTNN